MSAAARLRLGAAAGAVLLGLAAWLLTAAVRDEGGNAVATVLRERLEQTIETTGVVEAADPRVVAGTVPGRVSLVAVRAGDRVERHDVVATLDAAPYQAAVDAARRATEAAALRWTAAEARVAAEDEESTADAIAAQAEADAARDSLAAAERSLAQTRVLAPVAGTVLGVEVVEGQGYEAGTTIAVINAGDGMRVTAQLDQTDLPRVPVGTAVRVIVDPFPERELAGRMEAVAPRAAGEGAAVLFPAAVAVPGLADTGARPGMTATVIVPELVVEGALTVPEEAVTTVGRRSFVTVVRDGEEERVEVTTGARVGDRVEIVGQGIGEGDRVRLGE